MARRMKQERLFDPGPRGPDPWRLHPDKWVQQSNIVYHASNSTRMPRFDRGGNVNVGYGDSAGMHFGDKATAVERAVLTGRENIHAVRLNSSQFTPVMGDHEANYSDAAGKIVREGGVVQYHNAYENPGSVSYRALPESTRTWSQDVSNDPTAHRALQRLAGGGYNPVITASSVVDAPKPPVQEQLFAADVVSLGKTVAVHVNEDDAFDHAHRLAATGTPAGVKRNNLPQNEGWGERAKTAQPRLRRARELKPDPYAD